MRRTRKRKRISILYSIIILLFISSIGVGYAYLSSILNIKGNVKGTTNTIGGYTIEPGSSPDLKININLVQKWAESSVEKYRYQVNITNVSTATLTNISAVITFGNNIESVSITDANYTINKKVLTLTKANYNLISKATVSINFIVVVKTPNLKIVSVKLGGEVNPYEVGLDKINVLFNRISSSGSYNYQYNVTVANKTGFSINYWQLNVTLPSGTTYSSGTNALFDFQNNTLTIKCIGSNCLLSNNASTSFNMQLSTNIVNFVPSDVKVVIR